MAVSSKKYIQNRTGGLREKTSKLSRTVSRIIFYILLLAFIAVSVFVLFFSQYLQITSIRITGTQELNSQDIQQEFQASLDGKFLNIIPKNNFLFVFPKKVESLLENNFKKIRSASVTKKFPDSVTINIDERKAVLVWCSGEDCFLIDESGSAYNIADFDSPEIKQNNLLQINDQGARKVSIGETIVNSSYEQYVLGIKDALKNIGQEVSSEAYTTPSNMANEIDVKTEKGIQIYFSTQFPLDKAINAFEIVLKKEIPEDKLDSVEYVDLRSEGKVFYKFKNTDSQPVQSSDNAPQQ
jgi:cell division septal protein FtsQ